jgi:hypothetical protein
VEISEHENLPEKISSKRGRIKKMETKPEGKIQKKKRMIAREKDPFLELAKRWPSQVEKARELTDILLGEEETRGYARKDEG